MKPYIVVADNTDVVNFREYMKGGGRPVPGLPTFNPNRVVRNIPFDVCFDIQ